MARHSISSNTVLPYLEKTALRAGFCLHYLTHSAVACMMQKLVHTVGHSKLVIGDFD